MKKKRKKYTQEFKEEAVKLITEQGYRVTEAARYHFYTVAAGDQALSFGQ